MIGVAFLFAACLLLWEAGQPIIAVHFMAVLGRFDSQVGIVMAPLAFGAALTVIGVVMGIVSFQQNKTTSTWVWFVLADGVAPILALIGHGAAISLVGILPV